jgi:hypothetical protein
LAGVSAALGVGGITVGITEYHPPWTSAWFIVGAVMSAIGCVCAVWSLILYLARKQAADHWCPNLQAHVPQAVQTSACADQVTEEKSHASLQAAQKNAALAVDPAKRGLEVVIDDERPTWFPGAAVIVEIEFHVTNYDPVSHSLVRRAIRGVSHNPSPPTDSPEYAQVLHTYGMISERRRTDQLPNRVQAGETVRGVLIERFAWDSSGKLPDYTLIITDGRRQYTARPLGADEEPRDVWSL